MSSCSVAVDSLRHFCAVIAAGNIIGRTQTLTLFVESAYKEYNSEAAFAAAVLLSVLALCTLWVKDKVEQAAAAESAK